MAGVTDIQQIPTLFGHPDWKVVGDPQQVVNELNNPVPDQYTVILVDPEGHNRSVTIKQRKGLGPNEDPNAVFYDPVKGPADVPDTRTPQEQNENIARATADRVTAETRAKEAAVDLEKKNQDAREAAYNQSQGNGYLTHEQLRKQQQDAAAQGLNADQIAVQKSAMENNNLNTIVSNQIAAQNASTAAANAASQSRATEAQIKHIELGDADTAAKFEYLKAQDEIKQANDQRDQTLKDLTQQQQNAVQVQQNAIRGQELEQRAASDAATLEQRKVEAGQTAETQLQTAGTNAAANVFGTERQAQTAAGTIGGNLLSSRATAANSLLNNILTGAGGMSQGSAGRYGMLGGGLQASSNIAGLGQALASGVQNTITQQFGGQNTLDAAARMIRGAAPGAEMSPMGQVAIGVLHQVFDRMGQSGVPAAPVAAQAAANTAQQTGGMPAPVTIAPLDQSRNVAPVQNFNTLGSIGGTPGTGGQTFASPMTIAVPPPLAVNNLGNLDPRLRGAIY
jgi:hypothetical protein